VAYSGGRLHELPSHVTGRVPWKYSDTGVRVIGGRSTRICLKSFLSPRIGLKHVIAMHYRRQPRYGNHLTVCKRFLAVIVSIVEKKQGAS
jgi:hypothetical protein